MQRTTSARPIEAAEPAARLSEVRLGAKAVVITALWFGAVTGLLDLGCAWLRSWFLGASAWLGYQKLHPHYLWMIPAASLFLFGLCGVALAALARIVPRSGLRLGVPAFGFMTLLTLLLNVRPIHPAASALLALGLSVRLARALRRGVIRMGPLVPRSLAALLVLLAGLAVYSFGRESARERAARAGLPLAPPSAPNVLLIVLDAVRADALSPQGSARDTTPFLSRLARRGVWFENARAPAPWTLPSHATIFTGRWPHEVETGPRKPLDARFPTLAEYLNARGYDTAGFVGNYVFCTRDYGLGRGFVHYEDLPVSLDDVLGSSGLGRLVFPAVDALRRAGLRLLRGHVEPNSADPRWVTHRKSAGEIRRALLDWLSTRKGRPFFAFLNLYDAHAPYLPPRGPDSPFGIRPESRADVVTLRTWEQAREQDVAERVSRVSARDRSLARDGYDDCLRSLDRQLEAMFAELEPRGLLRNTLVVITSDHGEAFGEHGTYGHFNSVYREELDVPLLLVFPGRVPEGVRVAEPVSLRDLPATVVDLLGFKERSPFPGRTLARCWRSKSTTVDDSAADPVLSEHLEGGLLAIRRGARVYVRAASGAERLFDLSTDPSERDNLAAAPGAEAELARFRADIASLADAERRTAPHPTR